MSSRDDDLVTAQQSTKISHRRFCIPCKNHRERCHLHSLFGMLENEPDPASISIGAQGTVGKVRTLDWMPTVSLSTRLSGILRVSSAGNTQYSVAHKAPTARRTPTLYTISYPHQQPMKFSQQVGLVVGIHDLPTFVFRNQCYWECEGLDCRTLTALLYAKIPGGGAGNVPVADRMNKKTFNIKSRFHHHQGKCEKER